MKLYTLIEKSRSSINIYHLNKGTCKEAIEVLQEELDPTLARFSAPEYRYQSNSKKFITILLDLLKAEQGRTIVLKEFYRMKGGRIV